MKLRFYEFNEIKDFFSKCEIPLDLVTFTGGFHDTIWVLRNFTRDYFWQNSKQSLFRTLVSNNFEKTAMFPCLLVLLSLGWSGYLLVLTEPSKVDIVVQKPR